MIPVLTAAAKRSSFQWEIAFQFGLGSTLRLNVWRKSGWFGRIRVNNRPCSACASTSYLKTRQREESDTERWVRSSLTLIREYSYNTPAYIHVFHLRQKSYIKSFHSRWTNTFDLYVYIGSKQLSTVSCLDHRPSLMNVPFRPWAVRFIFRTEILFSGRFFWKKKSRAACWCECGIVRSCKAERRTKSTL